MLLGISSASYAQDTRRVSDRVGDVALRRVDPGADGIVDADNHRPPDIMFYEIGTFEPTNPRQDAFEGSWDNTGMFLRVDIGFSGLINPPGPLGGDDMFNPYRFGDHPLYGYIEIDIDGSINTGGELDFPNYRYTGNIARYGGMVRQPRFRDRVAFDDRAFDGDIRTPPFVERGGEEFHLAFIGRQMSGFRRKDADGDMIFEEGETWILFGRMFHRAHGYEPFSFACCRGEPGSYIPDSRVQFRHFIGDDVTVVTLVYPLINEGSARMRGEGQVQENDGDASNQSSIREALEDLVFSAQNANQDDRRNPNFILLADWEFKNAQDYLHPTAWDVLMMSAMSYTERDPDGALFVWTDQLPNVRRGDFDGSGRVNAIDLGLFAQFIRLADGNPEYDEDGTTNGSVDLLRFGPNFSIFDTNYDGFVDIHDKPRGRSHRIRPPRDPVSPNNMHAIDPP